MDLISLLWFPGNNGTEGVFSPGSLDLPELPPTALVSSYQPMFLAREPLVDDHLQHLKSPSQCSPTQSSDWKRRDQIPHHFHRDDFFNLNFEYMEEGSNSGVKKILTHFVMEVPMVTVLLEKNFTCFIFSNKFLLTVMLIFILWSGYNVLLSSV